MATVDIQTSWLCEYTTNRLYLSSLQLQSEGCLLRAKGLESGLLLDEILCQFVQSGLHFGVGMGGERAAQDLRGEEPAPCNREDFR